MMNKGIYTDEIVTKKREYIPPCIAISFIEMEEGIAAGSAFFKPVGPNGEVNEEWDTMDEEDINVDW
ncbi:TPA: hypothetical protein ACG0AO_000136 [Elizabethkingia meningoseptica]